MSDGQKIDEVAAELSRKASVEFVEEVYSRVIALEKEVATLNRNVIELKGKVI